MNGCRWKILFLAAACLFGTFSEFWNYSLGERVVNISTCIKNLVMFSVLSVETPNFYKMLEYQGDDIMKTLEGLKGLQSIFYELSILVAALAILQFMSIAIQQPATIVVVSLMSAVILAARLATLISPQIHQIWVDFKSKLFQSKKVELISEPNNYEFSHEQEVAIMKMVRSMVICGYNLLLLSISECLALICLLDSPLLAIGVVFNLIDDIVMGTLIVRATNRFEQIVSTTQYDISLLMEGLGQKHGVSGLFHRIGKVAFGVGVGKFVGVGFNIYKSCCAT
eukprot:TRINITY_DN7931_c0_g1_i1.p2 TRINITY_DN7931_c0_g1~~TRINITY_DN7931_c0_g1_i1.p2  ORF type:complete len:282 (-),score=20.34 TRINITY_DN7931_c0_g1_i1:296-1141(-)